MSLDEIAKDIADNPPIEISQIADADPRKYKEFFEHQCGHTRKENPVRSAIGGSITYEFTPTSIGTIIHLACACGKREDVTDYRLF